MNSLASFGLPTGMPVYLLSKAKAWKSVANITVGASKLLIRFAYRLHGYFNVHKGVSVSGKHTMNPT